jgi:KipI family sensor histidine kinase inhibitor
MTRRLLPYGGRGLLLECADLDETLGVLRALQGETTDRLGALQEIAEIVPGARTVYLRLETPPSRELEKALLDLSPTPLDTARSEEVEIAVHYDGEDLDEVADLTGLSRPDVIKIHTGQRWTVAFCGFAPGFGYLHGEHAQLQVPRRARPRTTVPAGAVGLADSWSGVYPRQGPGGWQLIGHTTRTLWDLGADPPALLQPGMSVRFVDLDA